MSALLVALVEKWTNENKEVERMELFLVVEGKGFHFLLIFCEELW